MTTLFVTVMKVFDIVKVTTNGQLRHPGHRQPDVPDAFSPANLGLGSALAIVLFVVGDPGHVDQHPPHAEGRGWHDRRHRQPRASVQRRRRVYRFLRSIPTWVLWVLVVVWRMPTLGLLINSFRGRDEQRSSGWWTVFAGNSTGLTLDNYRPVLGTTAAGGMKQA